MADKGICFVISPIGEDGTDTRQRADQVLTHIIGPAAEEAGYEPVRADKISEPGLITHQVIQHLIDCPMVVADLTGRNPNVFYEIAVRHAIRKPIVQIIQDGEPIPFDVSQSRTISVDHHDLDSVARCKDQLLEQIAAVEKDPSKSDNPISVTLELQSLRGSNNPADQQSAEIMDLLYTILRRIDVLESRGPDGADIEGPLDFLDAHVQRLRDSVLQAARIDPDVLPEAAAAYLRDAEREADAVDDVTTHLVNRFLDKRRPRRPRARRPRSSATSGDES